MKIIIENSSWFQDITGIITALAALIGVLLGVTGFDSWKKQLRGRTEYELARRYLRAIYKTRDAIKFVRNPFIPIGETITALKEAGKQYEDTTTSKEQSRAVYGVRWKKVNEAQSDLKVESLEAEVSWGKGALDIMQDFQSCVTEIYVALTMYLDADEFDERSRADKDLIYDLGESDQFNKRMEKAIQNIENYLKPYLK